MRVEKGKGHPLQVREEVIAQFVFDAPADADENLSHPESEKPLDHGDAYNHRRVNRKLFGHDRSLEIVHDVLQHPGTKHACHHSEHDHEKAATHVQPVAGKIRQQVEETVSSRHGFEAAGKGLFQKFRATPVLIGNQFSTAPLEVHGIGAELPHKVRIGQVEFRGSVRRNDVLVHADHYRLEQRVLSGVQAHSGVQFLQRFRRDVSNDAADVEVFTLHFVSQIEESNIHCMKSLRS